MRKMAHSFATGQIDKIVNETLHLVHVQDDNNNKKTVAHTHVIHIKEANINTNG